MRDLSNLSAEKILRITTPELLFSDSKLCADAEYKALAKRWHPDLERKPIGARVFAHVSDLHRLAIKRINDGSWNEPCDKVENEREGRRRFKLLGGVIKELEYATCREFELGQMYLADNHVAYEVRIEFADLMHNGCHRVQRLTYRDQFMAQSISNSLPQILDRFQTKASTVLVLRKTPDQLLLDDVLRHEGGRLNRARHAGWIINVLLDINCYMEWAGLTHNALSPSTIFISPLRHSGMLLGGWFYAALQNETLHALPDSSLQVFPADILLHKRADRRGDFECIKHILSKLFGTTLESMLAQNDLSPALREFILMPSTGQATTDYAFWKYKVWAEIFGRPRFIQWNLTSNDIYKEN